MGEVRAIRFSKIFSDFCYEADNRSRDFRAFKKFFYRPKSILCVNCAFFNFCLYRDKTLERASLVHQMLDCQLETF